MHRRDFIKLAAAGLVVTGSGTCGFLDGVGSGSSPVFVGKASSYAADLKGLLLRALVELRFDPARIALLCAEGAIVVEANGRLRVTTEGFPVLDAVVADLAA